LLETLEKLFLVVVDLCLRERAEKERRWSCRDAEARASEKERKVLIDGDMYITRVSEEYSITLFFRVFPQALCCVL
jgi:Trm5-related predicted tRNA methylase